MTVEFLISAYLDYQEAIDYYNLQSEGLGKKFSYEIDRAISLIKKYPESFTKYTAHTRKVICSSFPYNIVYSIEKGRILIIAVAHQHRKPHYWLNR